MNALKIVWPCIVESAILAFETLHLLLFMDTLIEQLYRSVGFKNSLSHFAQHTCLLSGNYTPFHASKGCTMSLKFVPVFIKVLQINCICWGPLPPVVRFYQYATLCDIYSPVSWSEIESMMIVVQACCKHSSFFNSLERSNLPECFILLYMKPNRMIGTMMLLYIHYIH